MCLNPKLPKVPGVQPLAQKTDAQVSMEAEADRLKNGSGIAASILTGGLGLTSTATTKGVSLGGY